MPEQRIISLLPSATETVCALGLQDRLVGRSHECDYPPSLDRLPVCSTPKYRSDGPSPDIDREVQSILRSALLNGVVGFHPSTRSLISMGTTVGTSRRLQGTFDRPGITLGKNPPNGVVVYYYMKTKPKEKDTLKLEFLEADGKLIKSFLGRKEKKSSAGQGRDDEDAQPTAPIDSGMNRFVWDRRYADAAKVPGAIMWSGSIDGPEAIPGKYQVRLKIGDKSWTRLFEIRKDPRVQTSQEEFKEQFDFLIEIRDKVSEAHRAVNTIRDIRKQTEDLVARLEKHPSKDTVASVSKKLNEQLKTVEEEIIQVKIKSGQDALNYPIKLNDKIATLSGVVSSADTRPTKQSYDVFTS